MRLNREPTPAERALLECAKAIDRLELELARMAQSIERLETRLEILETRDDWVESFRADDRAFEGLNL